MLGQSSSSLAGVPSAGGNCLTAEQLQLMSHLARQQQQQRPVYAPLEAVLGHGQGQGQLLAGYMQQQARPLLALNNAAVKPPQPQLIGNLLLLLSVCLSIRLSHAST